MLTLNNVTMYVPPAELQLYACAASLSLTTQATSAAASVPTQPCASRADLAVFADWMTAHEVSGVVGLTSVVDGHDGYEAL